ncbi:sugar transporter ERD6-like [Pollicipes pollicipes]|uniref:sugar transporter ERD6-like n=1 Tax=Pollicipes pollicipes TaxID=41117 RepID=UPI001884DF43|nr:sugar transporter ERD6-like [Pollicipes pollicipes]
MHRGASTDVVNKAILFYRGKKADVIQEVKDIQLSLRGRPNISIRRQVHLIFTDWDVAKPCLLMFVQFFFETFCGGVVLNQYALSVFQMAAMSLTPSQCAQVLAVLQMAAIGVSGFLLHWWGRRAVLIGSAVLTGLGQLTAAAYFHFEAALSAHTWLVMVGIIVANAASMGGISQLSHLYLGETLPVSVRQMYGSAISLYMGALSMAFIHLFPVVFARCLLPETRGLTLEQVQFKHFSTKRREEEPAEATAAAAAAKEAQERPEEEVDANKARPDSEEEQLENGTVAAAVVMSQTHVVFGVWVSFGGLLIAEAQSGDSAGTLSLQTATLVASIAHLGRMLGCVASAPLTDRLGVLRVIQLSVPLNLLAWPMMTLGGRSMMVAGAVMAGAFVGLNASGGRLYIAEVTSNRTRGTLCYLPGVAIGLSLLVNFSVSAAIPWRYATLLCGCTPSVVHFLAFTTRWLLSRGGREKEAQRAIAFYRGKRADVAMETKHILQVLRGRPTPNILQQARLIFTDWDVAKPCLLLLVQFFFDSFCGGIVLTQYAPGLFRMAVRSLAPAQCTQLLAALQVLALVGSACLLRWWGRRTVLIGAASVACLGMLTVAAFFKFQATLGLHTWLVVVGVVLANAGSLGGVSALSHLFCGELLPLAVRQMFGNVLSLYMGALGMTFIHLFPVLREALGLSGLFAALAGTRGLTLEQVQFKHFSTKRRAEEEAEATAATTETAAARDAQERGPSGGEELAQSRDQELCANGDLAPQTSRDEQRRPSTVELRGSRDEERRASWDHPEEGELGGREAHEPGSSGPSSPQEV